MRRSLSRVTRLIALTAIASLPLQGVAFAVLPVDHAPKSPGHENHEVAYTGAYDSKLTHSYNADKKKFVGTLKSTFSDPGKLLEHAADEKVVCVKDRKVTVFKKIKNRADKKMGSSKADAGGSWSVGADVTRGKYYAKVARSEMLIREYYNGIDFYAKCKPIMTSPSRL